MWEAAEHILQDFKHDHLVIFDCCDAGFLSARGSHHAFEYLAACQGKKATREPGAHSFTTALIWALQKIKSGPRFTMLQLKEQIQQYKDFPDDQRPLVFARPDHIAGPISIAPIAKGTRDVVPTLRRSLSHISPMERSYVDLRFFFIKDITAEHAKSVADLVRPTVLSKSFDLNATHVSFLGQGKTENLMKYRNHWRRARDCINLVSHASQSRKRTRDKEAGQTLRKSSKTEIEATPGRPITPVSDEPRSDTEAWVNIPPVRIDAGTVTTIDVHVPLVIAQDSVHTQHA